MLLYPIDFLQLRLHVGVLYPQQRPLTTTRVSNILKQSKYKKIFIESNCLDLMICAIEKRITLHNE